MFFFWALIAAFFHAFQNTLIVKHSRKIGGLSICIYRSLSLIITMTPILYWADFSSFTKLPQHFPYILLAGALGAISSSTGFASMKYMTVAVSGTFKTALSVIFSFLFGALFLFEIPTIWQIIFSSVIIIGGFFLGTQKKDFKHLDNNVKKGFILATIAAFCSGMMMTSLAYASRNFDPYITGYLWEASIGIFALIIGVAKKPFTGKKITKIDSKTFFKITLLASPTLIGTLAFMKAIPLGSIGVLSSITLSGIIISLALAYFLYDEKLSKKQIFWIFFMIFGIAGLKLLE